MVNVKIIGAGSIGNHLAYGCRKLGWNVTIVDVDQKALDRTKNEIYPQRYGAWDDQIILTHPQNVTKGGFDVVMIGTPPSSHLKIALQTLIEDSPKILHIEKPLCTPDLAELHEFSLQMKKSTTMVVVGYNHTVCPFVKKAEDILLSGKVGNLLSISGGFFSTWAGVLKAHPWLKGPHETYLGFTAKGGGASGEHSHALNLWQHFAHFTNKGNVTQVSATLDVVKTDLCEYDQAMYACLQTENGLVGTCTQDVITTPKSKCLKLHCEKGVIEIHNDYYPNCDVVFVRVGEVVEEIKFAKQRPDDFKYNLALIQMLLDGKTAYDKVPTHFDRAAQTMLVLAAVSKSHNSKTTMKIDYSKGYTLDAISPL